MNDVGKLLKKKIPTKPLLISVAVILVAITLAVAYWFNNYAFGIDKYHAAQERCGSKRLAVGHKASFQSDKLVYDSIAESTGNDHDMFGAEYFCSDEEAEAAGYTLSEL